MTVYPNPRVGLGNVSSLSRPVQQNLAANQTPAWNETLTSTPHKYPNSTIDGLSPDDSCQPALCRQLFVASPASISPAASSLQSQLVNTATMVSEYWYVLRASLPRHHQAPLASAGAPSIAQLRPSSPEAIAICYYNLPLYD